MNSWQDKPIVILTALSVEYEAIKRHLTKIRPAKHPTGTIYEVGVLPGGQATPVALIQAGIGNVGAGIETERAISYFRPSHAFFVGVGGGIKDVSLGDVVVATKTYGYERGKDAVDFKSRPDVWHSSYDMVQLSQKIAREDAWQSLIRETPVSRPRALIAPIAAGEKVVSSTRSDTYRLLRKRFSDAVAVEMEGLGLLQAGHAHPRISMLVVRGISDLIDGKDESDAKNWQAHASANAAAFVSMVISEIWKTVQAISVPLDNRTGIWKQLEDFSVSTYPSGPTENEAWGRAGGDVSSLKLGSTGRGAWYDAIRNLRLGGGGKYISVRSLLLTMEEDFPNSTTIREFLNRIEEFGTL